MVVQKLSKSKYLAGQFCERMLWRDVHRPVEEGAADKLTRLETGQDVGRMAQELFPGGVLVSDGPLAHHKAVERTASLMGDETVPAIFEAAFEYDNVLVRVDILERMGRGAWGLREVKATSKAKDEHLEDIAVQLHVLKGAGVKITSAELIHVNGDYGYDGVSIDPEDYFVRADLTKQTKQWMKSIPENVSRFHEVLSQKKEPDVALGKHCKGCHHWDHCTAHMPEDWLIFLPHIRQDRIEDLMGMGIESISAIPDDYGLSGNQTRVRDVVRAGKPYVDAGLADDLKGFGPPAHYLDFETINPTIPLYEGTKPWQRIPFQYSLHSVKAFGKKPKHRAFLAEGGMDPRRALAKSLIDDLKADDWPIVVYNQSFEITVLRDLGQHFDDLRPQLTKIIQRIVDLRVPISQHVTHPDFYKTASAKSSALSIKNVLPVLTGSSYDELDGVADGATASATFEAIDQGVLVGDELKEARRQLCEYCKLDTWAMVELHKKLHVMVG